MARPPEISREVFAAQPSELEISSAKLNIVKSDSQLWSTFNDQEIKLNVIVSETDIRSCSITPEMDSVLDLKHKVTIPQLFSEELKEDKRIRLIYQGKLLLDSYKLALYSQRHAELSDQAIVHCAISSAPTGEEEPSEIATEELRGLDKLFDLGYSPDEIQDMRFHFHMMCKHEGTIKMCKKKEELLELEEAYLKGLLPTVNLHSEERFNWDMTQLETVGNGFDILWGAVFGAIMWVPALILVGDMQPKVFKMTELQVLGLKAGIAAATIVGLPLCLYYVTKGA